MMLEVRGVSKDFMDGSGDHLRALEGIDLTVKDDQVVAILGPSGCGKTTLLRIIAGLERPTSGVVLLDGTEVRRPTPRMGMIFQEHSLLPWCSVLDNVCIGLEMSGISRQESREKATAYLDMVGLGKSLERLPYELSGGMRQRASIARALTMDPAILLMDEPFSALDPLTRRHLQDDILRIQERTGKAIIIVTHSVDEAILLCDQIFILSARPGRIHKVMTIDLEKPRRSSDPGFIELRRDILGTLEELASPPP